MPLYEIPKDVLWFPDPSEAMPDGLLGIGGDLSPERLMLAYSMGIFPWFNEEDPVLWWSPPERCVLFPEKAKTSKSMRQVLKSGTFELQINTAFEEVIRACANTPRGEQDGTWITEEMITAYTTLHGLGYAHSAEVWQEGKLVGGLYGVKTGNIFCGESMFSRVSNASKATLILFAKMLYTKDIVLIDCQNHTPHLISMGAEMISRNEYLAYLHEHKSY